MTITATRHYSDKEIVEPVDGEQRQQFRAFINHYAHRHVRIENPSKLTRGEVKLLSEGKVVGSLIRRGVLDVEGLQLADQTLIDDMIGDLYLIGLANIPARRLYDRPAYVVCKDGFIENALIAIPEQKSDAHVLFKPDFAAKRFEDGIVYSQVDDFRYVEPYNHLWETSSNK